MAPRATQQTYASQSKKKGGGASQRARHDEDHDDSSEQDDDEQDYEGEAMAGAGSQMKSKKSKAAGAGTSGGGALSGEELQRLSKNIVRLALAMQGKRGKLTRAEINLKALPEKSKAFNPAFAGAQRILRDTFGMELVELMSRTERDKLGEEPEKEEAGAKKATVGAKAYILRSTLPPALTKAASVKDNELLAAEIKDLQDLGLAGEGEDDDRTGRSQGVLLAWKSVEPIALTGVLQVILCLILVNGRSMPEAQLKNQLKHFHLHWNSVFPMPGHETEKEITLERYLDRMKIEEMLDSVTVAALGAAGGATQALATQNRRKSRATADENQVVEWKWGVRAHAEISEESVAQFMTSFMKNQWKEEEERLLDQDEEDEAAANATFRKKNKQKGTVEERRRELTEEAKKYAATVYKDVVRAAGGSLTEIKPAA